MALEQNSLISGRLEKLSALRENGIDPFPALTPPRLPVERVRASDPGSGAEVSTSGRVRARREHGRTVFADLSDPTGRIQLYFNSREVSPELWVLLGHVDLGDIIWVTGTLFTTRMGELTLAVSGMKLLAKSVRPLPVVKVDSAGEVHDAVSDPDLLYRHRCVDLLLNPESRERFENRSRIISAMRAHLDGQGFIEAETPILQQLYGGASAEPFTTTYNFLDQKCYLRIATELYLKRLMVGGFHRVYEIGKDFRNEGVDRTHSPEFTQLELYEAWTDYRGMMARFEELVAVSARAVGKEREVSYQGQTLRIEPPFPRIPFVDALHERSGERLFDFDPDRLAGFAANLGIAVKGASRPDLLDKLFDHFVTPGLVQPCFVTDYPVELSPLAKGNPSDSRLTERFEAFMAGTELANAFSEQNDPVLQRRILEEQAAGDGVRQGEVDEEFLYALEVGMPPAGGLGVGVDRLVMILTDAGSIRDTILFPHLRRER
jgi:lysyl-tRNA synthetase class 2